MNSVFNEPAKKGSKPPLYLIDASIYIFRAYFTLPDSIQNRHGQPMNAVHGFALFLAEFIKKTQCSHVLIAFDESLESCFRNKIYPDYKANRVLPDDDLALQLKACQQVCRAMGIKIHKSKRYEADDIIGSAAEKFRTKSRSMIYVSRDKDLAQLIQQQDIFWDYQSDKKTQHKDFVLEKGFSTDIWPDYLALTGDQIDNIPGIPGVGQKTATVLMQNFNGLENLYTNLDTVSDLPLRGAKKLTQQLDEYQEHVFTMREITRIYRDMSLPFNLQDLKREAWDEEKFSRFCSRMALGGRLEKAVSNKLST